MANEVANSSVIEQADRHQLEVSYGEANHAAGSADFWPIWVSATVDIFSGQPDLGDAAIILPQTRSENLVSNTAITALAGSASLNVVETYGATALMIGQATIGSLNLVETSSNFALLSSHGTNTGRKHVIPELDDFRFGKPEFSRPSPEVVMAAYRLVRSTRVFTYPAVIAVDDDGALAIEMRFKRP